MIRTLCLSAGLVLIYTICVQGIMWHLEPNTRKCLREELGQNVLIAGDYDVTELPGQRVDYQVIIIKQGATRGESLKRRKNQYYDFYHSQALTCNGLGQTLILDTIRGKLVMSDM